VVRVIRAVLLDLDGTLYHQTPLRAAMACELAIVPGVSRGIGLARSTWNVLRTFRRVREELRALGHASDPLEVLQYTATAERLAMDAARVRAIVGEWIHTRPLRHLRRARRAGVASVLESLDRSGLEVG
jgi:FMN phosphatase YigB (HAD superfamily)